MEKAIYITKIQDLSLVSKEYQRVYFGNEFCERLIPDSQDLKSVINFSRERRISLTYVTPFFTEFGLRLVGEAFKQLEKSGFDAEVVINDWGALQLLKGRNFKILLGRILTKQKRDPRIQDLMDSLTPAQKEYYQGSNLDSPGFLEFLEENRIERVELDNLIQGIFIPPLKGKIKASLYYPYIYVSTARRCEETSSQRTEINHVPAVLPCDIICRRSEDYFIMKSKDMKKEMILKGNTIFCHSLDFKNNLPDGVDRLVYMPKIPM